MKTDNRPQKPKLIDIVDGNFYWVRPFFDKDFEPAKAKYRYGSKELYFGFTDGSVMEVKRAWEAEPLIYGSHQESEANKLNVSHCTCPKCMKIHVTS